MYTAMTGLNAPEKWINASGTIYGHSRQLISNNFWWPGTKYVKIVILANYNQTEAQELEVDMVKLDELR